MRRRKWIWTLAVFGMVIFATLAVLEGLADFDLSRHQEVHLSFQHGDVTIAGTLILPSDGDAGPVALIVHGDGAQDRFSSEGYLPLINTLLDAGVGIYTWDKPGVGQSSGDWLDQSMSDRTEEALAAFNMIRALPNLDPEHVGFLGFSQAGWVLPDVAVRVEPAFTVLVGAAVDWQRQGAYYTMTRLSLEGIEGPDAKSHLEVLQAADATLFAESNSPTDAELGNMARERYKFIKRNRFANAGDQIGDMRGPVLAIWGVEDLNVDPNWNAAFYQQAFADDQDKEVRIIPDATHGLLRNWPFNAQLVTQWPKPVQFAFVAAGRKAFAPNTLEELAVWIHAQKR